jgi:uncharacterized protein YbcI
MTVNPTTQPSGPEATTTAATISHVVVRIVSEYTGRGPTKAWTSISGDLVTCLMRDTLTRGERSLVADGRAQLVLDMRKAFQATMREDLIAGVEEATGRTVIGFMSDNHIDPDLAIEAFVLAPLEGPG